MTPMNSERISVIIPVYNTEKYVEKAVRSVMEQTYPNLEIICVNDGSTDGSAEILYRLQKEDPRIIVVEKENGGLGDARNAGLSRASSEWVTFLDSDDYLERNAYETVSNAFAEKPDLISFGTRIVVENGFSTHGTERKYYSVNYVGLVDICRDAEKLISGMDVSACNKLFRKSVLDKYAIRFEKIYYEDFPFVMQYLFCITNVYFFKEQLYNYLRHPGSIMAETFNATPRSIDHLRAIDYLFSFLRTNGGLVRSRECMLAKMFCKYYVLSVRYSVSEKRQEIVDYSKELYEKYGFLRTYLAQKFENNTFYYVRNRKSHLTTVLLQKLFSLKWEFMDYRLCKVARLFNVIIYKKMAV